MVVKIENMDMPKICSDCPMFEKQPFGDVVYFLGTPLDGKCKALPIKDYDGNIVDYQTVSKRSEIENKSRSKFCPLKECE